MKTWKLVALVLVAALALPLCSIAAEQTTVPLTMAVVSNASILDYNTNNFTLWLEETAHVDIEFIVVQEDVKNEKMNLLLNSGNYPDIWMNVVPDEYMYGIETNVLVELTPYINGELMPNLVAALADNPDLAVGAKAMDGNMYAFPSCNLSPHTRYYNKVWYNTMQLEKTGMDVPTTIDSFYDVLKKYKEVNPEGIPLTGEVTQMLGFITNMFTYYPNSDYGLRIVNGTTIETMMSDEEYREALRYMSKLYEEGLIYEATFNMDDSQRKAMITSEGEPVLFMAQKHNARFVDGNATPALYAHMQGLEPLVGSNGTQYVTYYPTAVNAKAAISYTCEDVEKACALIDLFYSGEGALRNYWGTPGVDWDYAQEGQLNMDGEQAYYVRLNNYSNEVSDRSWVTTGIYYTASWLSPVADTETDLSLPANGGVLRQRVTNELYAPHYQTEYQTLPVLKFTADETEEVNFLGTSLGSYISQSTVEFIVGALDIDTDWDTYAKALDQMGMDRLISLYQTAYDRILH